MTCSSGLESLFRPDLTRVDSAWEEAAFLRDCGRQIERMRRKNKVLGIERLIALPFVVDDRSSRDPIWLEMFCQLVEVADRFAGTRAKSVIQQNAHSGRCFVKTPMTVGSRFVRALSRQERCQKHDRRQGGGDEQKRSDGRFHSWRPTPTGRGRKHIPSVNPPGSGVARQMCFAGADSHV